MFSRKLALRLALAVTVLCVVVLGSTSVPVKALASPAAVLEGYNETWSGTLVEKQQHQDSLPGSSETFEADGTSHITVTFGVDVYVGGAGVGTADVSGTLSDTRDMDCPDGTSGTYTESGSGSATVGVTVVVVAHAQVGLPSTYTYSVVPGTTATMNVVAESCGGTPQNFTQGILSGEADGTFALTDAQVSGSFTTGSLDSLLTTITWDFTIAKTPISSGGLTLQFVNSPKGDVQPTAFHRRVQRTGRIAINGNHLNVQPQRITVEVDENGQPTTQPLTVHIDDTSVDDGAGHAQGPGTHPHGWLYQVCDPNDPTTANAEIPTRATVKAEGAIGGSQDIQGIDLDINDNNTQNPCITNNTGQATFVWLPAEIAGTDTLKVTVKGDTSVTPATKDIPVRLGGLVALAPDPLHYRLTGQLPAHPANHYGTPGTSAALRAAAQNYIDIQRNDPQLQALVHELAARYHYALAPDLLGINDMSLQYGGLFDINNNWSPPHLGHRWGDNADFQTNNLVANPGNPDNFQNAVGAPHVPVAVSNLVKLAHIRMFHDLERALRAAGGHNIIVEANHLDATF